MAASQQASPPISSTLPLTGRTNSRSNGAGTFVDLHPLEQVPHARLDLLLNVRPVIG
jgi:hypothetical protein